MDSLALHFVLDFSAIWFVVALALWVLALAVWMWIMGWATRCGSIPDPPKENRNPYSVRNEDIKKL